MKKKWVIVFPMKNLNKPTYFQFRDYMIAELYFMDQPPALLK